MTQKFLTFKDIPGFFLPDCQCMSYWQCCTVSYLTPIPPLLPSPSQPANPQTNHSEPRQCNFANKIWDKNHAWNNKQRESCTGTTGFIGGVVCNHDHCGKCYDLNPLGDRVQSCNGDKYQRLQAGTFEVPYTSATTDSN